MGGYDAIRVYLWVGMMSDKDAQKARLLTRFRPMATMTTKHGVPPEKVDVASGKPAGKGPVGFSAAMLPFYSSVMRRRYSASALQIIFPIIMPITATY